MSCRYYESHVQDKGRQASLLNNQKCHTSHHKIAAKVVNQLDVVIDNFALKLEVKVTTHDNVEVGVDKVRVTTKVIP